MAVVDLFILGIDTVITLLFYTFYRSSKSAAKKVKNAPEFDITPELMSKVKEAADETLPYACIRGSVEAEDTAIASAHKPGTLGVIQSLLLKEHRTKRSQGHWSDNSRVLRDITKIVPFIVCGEDKAKVIINEPGESEYLLENLTVIYDHFEPSKTNIFEKGLDRIFGEVTKGFQETEYMLPVGTRLTGVGELSIEKGALTLAPPTDGTAYILSALTKTELVKRLEDKAFIYKVLGGIFGVAGGIILIILLKKYFEEYRVQHEFEDALGEIRNMRSHRHQRLRTPNIDVTETNNTLLESSDESDSRFCVVCLNQPREVVLLDCGHICVCADCVELLPIPRKCPVCRDTIARILPIYVS